MQSEEDLLLEECKNLIEQELGWGSSSTWTNQDFEKLSDIFVARTKVNLSPATLKRIWGKVKYTSKPTITTLDTLAQFVNYENWRSFKLQQLSVRNSDNGRDKTAEKYFQKSKRNVEITRGIKWALLTSVLVIILSLFLYSGKKDASDDNITNAADVFSFSSKKVVAEGIPNSVLFTYDASGASEGDSIYIQQSWDTRLRERVSRDAHSHRSIYYSPGYFLAKLVVNNQIVKEHSLYIRSNGWLPMIEQEKVPVYLKPEDAIRMDGVMTVDIDEIVENNIPLQPEPPWVAFHNAREFGELRSDNFIFETEVKNDYKEGAGVCQLTEIHIRWEGGMIMIPLSIPGCVSAIALFDVNGRNDDSSLLGSDFSDWVNVRLEVKDKNGELFINGKKAYDLNLNIPSVSIVGLLYRFQGTGSVNFTKLSSVGGEVVYEDNF